MRILLFFILILILFVVADSSVANPPSWANPGGNDGIIATACELDFAILIALQEEQNMLLREQAIGLQYLLCIASILFGIILGYVFLSGLKLR